MAMTVPVGHYVLFLHEASVDYKKISSFSNPYGVNGQKNTLHKSTSVLGVCV